MDELAAARAMAAGELESPQKYGTFWLFAIRITSTGAAYRIGRDEYCWRDPSIYLNDDFLARCNGLPVIWDHPPDKPTLDSEEWASRAIGTTFVPYIKGEDVWAIVKIYDTAAANAMREGQLSTSPAVVFGANSGNETIKLTDGSALLIEGRPALLDHIAVCEQGVWDKGGDPTGVQNDTLTDEGPGMAEKDDATAKLDSIADALTRLHSRMDSMEAADKARKDADERKDRHDRARKDRFGRKDGESFKDWKGRMDADEAAMCDALRKDGEEEEEAKTAADKARKDAEDEARKDEGFEKWAKEEAEEPAHKDRKDGEEKEDDKHREDRKDSTMTADAVAMKARIADLERMIKGLTHEAPASERDALATAQARADAVAMMFGDKASAPVPGETPLAYRRRLMGKFQKHSDRFKETRLDTIGDPAAFSMIEDAVYADAVSAAKSPAHAQPGTLIPIVTREGGRDVTRYHGDILTWMAPFMTPGTTVRAIRNPKVM